MQRNPLGKTEISISSLALGTMTFGAETNKVDSFRQLDIYVDQGGTHIDTADGYAGGKSEEIIGEWISQRGKSHAFTIATKGRFSPPEGSAGASRRSLIHSVDASLRRMNVDAFDLYYVHGWDPQTDILETLQTLGDLVDAGKIKQISWSNVSGWQLQKIVALASSHGLPSPVALQAQYNLLERGIELEVLPCCLENNIAVTVWSPLAGGWLTGKYAANERPADHTRLGEDPDRGDGYDYRNTERTYTVLRLLQDIANDHNRPITHPALAWAVSRPRVASVLVGARTVKQLEANLAAADFFLSQEEMSMLTQASALEALPYPYNFLEDPCGMDIWKVLGTRQVRNLAS
ncbi:aldo/keto reductase [uncultured Roseibium sp.]|uniref:aldo/keto reductase n=1 Tax=uncultured Roseibium sp. TaxID=1936171 RepID=UPI00263216F6|nr:aldo/keto reductase [uncultured Roseibium sp.]